ncbi:crosslink repair DNA glycosylase YcaQ family protein [Vannielia sp.]|uniref:winged helix-turn-helix domain-containing protein n=1 Tax=Vannielia sp. TaxID=2813045 RepID=UPI00261F2975|nr:crosslink repair DNA glycosylase YcaQ family protein [Vannielia sp.]MDF1871688.1 crosslink repair DNA glycosylase YcaQ family protein [Vannielia sp.]
MTALHISNSAARGLWLATNHLATAPTGRSDMAALIHDLGFVQLDTIQVISRAHHHILWSRAQSYREPMLDKLLARDRAVFEHFTHDASVLPMEFLPMWQRQFTRMKAKVARSSWFGKHLDTSLLASVKRQIAEHGPACTRHFDTQIEGPRKMWRRPPHKLALDYLWYAGELATCHREGFTKFYDLAERVFPADLRRANLGEEEQINWLCTAALKRLGVATPTEIRRFWEAVEPGEVTTWAKHAPHVEVEVQSADGTTTRALATPDIEQRLAALKPATRRLRILNPFDPAIRDRTRLKRLFGFDYTVEMFVPAAKRQWGYYVYPLLEGARFVGRIEAKANRAEGTLTVSNLWWEPGITATPNRTDKLHGELARLARLAGVETVRWA